MHQIVKSGRPFFAEAPAGGHINQPKNIQMLMTGKPPEGQNYCRRQL
jgi:hypothetical protein